METYKVVSPLGFEVVESKGSADRLNDLNGKTVGEFWNGVFKGDVSFPLIRQQLMRRFPDLRIIPFTEFPHAPAGDHPSKQRELAQKMAKIAIEKGCDGVISGNGA